MHQPTNGTNKMETQSVDESAKLNRTIARALKVGYDASALSAALFKQIAAEAAADKNFDKHRHGGIHRVATALNDVGRGFGEAVSALSPTGRTAIAFCA
jgi:hypothetical protein